MTLTFDALAPPPEGGAAPAAPRAAPEVAVTDRGNGLYELRFTLACAGSWALGARLAGGGRAAAACSVACAPGAASPEHFEAASALGTWAAGEVGTLTITRR